MSYDFGLNSIAEKNACACCCCCGVLFVFIIMYVHALVMIA